MNLTDNMGTAVVIESSGNTSGISNSFSLAMKGGNIVLLGIPYSDLFIERTYFEKIRACVKKSVNKKAFYDKIKKIIGGVFYV